MALTAEEQAELNSLKALDTGSDPAPVAQPQSGTATSATSPQSGSGLSADEAAELEQLKSAPSSRDQSTVAAGAEPEEQNWLMGMIDSTTHGMLQGWGAKATAAEAALLGRPVGGGIGDEFQNYEGTFGERYEAALAAEKAQNEKFGDANPISSTIGELGGSVASAIATGGATAPLKAAALSGAAYGSGEAESGEELSGAAFGAVTGIAAYGVLKGVGKAVKKGLDKTLIADKYLKNQSKSSSAIFAKAKELYQKIDNSDVRLTERSSRNLGQDVKLSIFKNDLAIDPNSTGLNQKAVQFVDSVGSRLGSNPTIKQLESVRKAAYADLYDGTNDRFGHAIRKTIDEHIAKLKPAEIKYTPRSLGGSKFTQLDTPGGAYRMGTDSGKQVLKDLQDARALYKTGIKTEKIQELLVQAKEELSSQRGGDIGSKLKIKFRQLLKAERKYTNPMDDNKSLLFSNAEIDAITKILDGTKGENILRRIGNSANTFPMRGMTPWAGAATLGAFNAPAGVAAGIGLGGAALARRSAGKQTERQAQKALGLVANQGKQAMPELPNTLLEHVLGKGAAGMFAGSLDYSGK